MDFICPACNSRNVGLGSSLYRHAKRAILGSHKRYCRNCELRWHHTKSKAPYRIPAALLLFLAFAALLNGPAKPLVRAIRSEGGTDFTFGAKDVRNSSGQIVGALNTADGTGGDAAHPALGGIDEGPAAGAGPVTASLAAAYGKNVQYAAAAPASNQGLFMKLFSGLTGSTNKPGGAMRESVIQDLKSMNKRQLWDKYGNYFGGDKERAKAAYHQYKSSGKIPGE